MSSLAAVVLNYCTPEQTWLTVRSLQTSFDTPDHIFVVDNGSPDASATQLRSSLQGVELLETDRNLGFAGGCNVGITAALARGADMVLLVNSDVVLAPDGVGNLRTAARDHPATGILAPLLLSREEPDQIASAGIAYARRSGRMRHQRVGESFSTAIWQSRSFEVNAVSGCVMLIRREVFERVGFLQEDYFFSFEDIDLCLRARADGFQTRIVPAARAYHEGGRSIGRRSPRRVYFATRNHLKLAATMPSDRLGNIARTGFIIGLNTAYVLVSPDTPFVSGLVAVARGAWHHLRGRYGPD